MFHPAYRERGTLKTLDRAHGGRFRAPARGARRTDPRYRIDEMRPTPQSGWYRVEFLPAPVFRGGVLFLSKRLEVFPKLHIQTDKLGATIRYYKKHRNIIELKKGLKVFFTQLADWDAKYCIFAGLEVTKSIAVLRRKLEEEDSWVEANNSTIISDNDVEWLYHKLQDLEKALKEEMAVFFTSFEDEGKKETEGLYNDLVK